MHSHPREPSSCVEIHLLRDRAECLFTLAEWLHSEWFAPAGAPFEEAVQTLTSRLQAHALPLTFVALQHGQPVGMVSLVRDRPERRRPHPCLAGLYVIPPARRQGIATRLCEHAIAHTRRLGLPTLALYTIDCDTFYQRLGWTREPELAPQKGSHPAASFGPPRHTAGRGSRRRRPVFMTLPLDARLSSSHPPLSLTIPN